MNELSGSVTDQPRAVPAESWRSDTATIVLRISVLLCAAGGVIATIRGIHAAWQNGVAHEGPWTGLVQQAWGITPFARLLRLLNANWPRSRLMSVSEPNTYEKPLNSQTKL